MSTSFFGNPNGIDTRDYILKMDGATPVSLPENLVGHTVTSPNVDLSDALNVTRAVLKNGRIRTITVTKRAPEVRGRQYTIGFPDGALWTPVVQLALRSGCRSTFYMVYACPEDSRLEHAQILPDALIDPIQPEGDIVLTEEDALIKYTTTLRIPDETRLWNLGFSKIYTEGAAVDFNAVTALSVDCPDCADVPGLSFIAVGGDGIAVPLNEKTDDRFATQDTLVTGAAATQRSTSVAQEGAVVVIGNSSAAAPAPATTGGLRVSFDGGTTWTSIAAVTEPIFDVIIRGNTVIAVGGIGAAPAAVWASFDRGASFTDIVSSALPATNALTAIDYDEDRDKYYIVGEDGTLLTLTVSGSVVTISDISANLDGAPTLLNDVRVLATDFIAVGGASGYYAESFDGGVTFVQKAVAGSTAITAIAGTKYRTVVSAGTNLYKRDVLSNYDWATIALEGGDTITGVVMDVREVETFDSNFNMFVAVTAAGEVILGKPFYPNA